MPATVEKKVPFKLRPLKYAFVFGLLVLLPLSVVILSWLQVDTELWRHLLEHQLGFLTLQTVSLAVGTLIWTGFLGVSLAALVAFTEFPGRRFLSWALLLPFALPAYVQAFVWVDLLDYSGLVPTFLRQSFGLDLVSWPSVRSLPGAWWALSLSFFIYVYLLTLGAFYSQGRRSLEVARSLGYSPWQGFWRVSLPLAKPWVGAGLLLVLMEVLSDYGTVALLGVDSLTVGIFRVWYGHFSLSTAAQLASLLTLVVFAIVVLESRLRQRQRFYEQKASGLAGSGAQFRSTRGLRLAAMIFSWTVFALAFVLPMGRLLWLGASVQDYHYAWASVFPVLLNTLVLGGLAAVLTALAAFFMVADLRLRGGGLRSSALRLGALGYALPGAVLAVGVFTPLVLLDKQIHSLLSGWFEGGGGLLLTGTLWAMLLGYFIRFLAIPLLSLGSASQNLPGRMDEAARSLGEAEGGLVRRLYWPLLKKGLLISLPLVVVDVMKEMPMTLMMRPTGWDTLSVRIFQLTSEGLWAEAAWPAVILSLSAVVPIYFFLRPLTRVGLRYG